MRCCTHGRLVYDLESLNGLGLLEYYVGNAFGSGTAIRYIVLDAKVVVRSTGIVTSGEKDTAVSRVFSNHIGSSGSGKNSILSNNKFVYAVCRSDSQDDLDSLGREEPAVAPDNDGSILCIDRVKDRLDEIFSIILC